MAERKKLRPSLKVIRNRNWQRLGSLETASPRANLKNPRRFIRVWHHGMMWTKPMDEAAWKEECESL